MLMFQLAMFVFPEVYNLAETQLRKIENSLHTLKKYMVELLCLNLFGPSISLTFSWLCHLECFGSSYSYQAPSVIVTSGRFLPPNNPTLRAVVGFPWGFREKKVFKFTKHLNGHILCHFFTSSMPSKITTLVFHIYLTVEAKKS